MTPHHHGPQPSNGQLPAPGRRTARTALLPGPAGAGRTPSQPGGRVSLPLSLAEGCLPNPASNPSRLLITVSHASDPGRRARPILVPPPQRRAPFAPSAERPRVARNRRSGLLALATFGALLLSGCHHEPVVPPLPPQAQAPPEIVKPAQPDLPPMQGPPPVSVTPAQPTVTAQVKPKKHPRKPSPTPAETAASKPPEPVAQPVAPPPEAQLGTLSPGGASTPQEQQSATARIEAIEHRIASLSPATAEHQKSQIAQIRVFLKQANDALKSGDTVGGANLITKASLLLDDIAP